MSVLFYWELFLLDLNKCVYVLFYSLIWKCVQTNLYFQRMRAFVNVYRFVCAHFIGTYPGGFLILLMGKGRFPRKSVEFSTLYWGVGGAQLVFFNMFESASQLSLDLWNTTTAQLICNKHHITFQFILTLWQGAWMI